MILFINRKKKQFFSIIYHSFPLCLVQMDLKFWLEKFCIADKKATNHFKVMWNIWLSGYYLEVTECSVNFLTNN